LLPVGEQDAIVMSTVLALEIFFSLHFDAVPVFDMVGLDFAKGLENGFKKFYVRPNSNFDILSYYFHLKDLLNKEQFLTSYFPGNLRLQVDLGQERR
jgi:hypothetical protein